MGIHACLCICKGFHVCKCAAADAGKFMVDLRNIMKNFRSKYSINLSNQPGANTRAQEMRLCGVAADSLTPVIVIVIMSGL